MTKYKLQAGRSILGWLVVILVLLFCALLYFSPDSSVVESMIIRDPVVQTDTELIRCPDCGSWFEH